MYPWPKVSSCQVLCLPYVLSMQWCWYSGRVSERQSGFKSRTHTVGSEGAMEMLGATAPTIGMLWLTAQQRLVATGTEAKKYQRVQWPWLFHSQGNGRCRSFQPRWVDPRVESVVRKGNPLRHRLEIARAGWWSLRVARCIHWAKGSDEEGCRCVFKGPVSCQEKIMDEERTNAHPADKDAGLSPIVQGPLQWYVKGEGQKDPAARSGDLL